MARNSHQLAEPVTSFAELRGRVEEASPNTGADERRGPTTNSTLCPCRFIHGLRLVLLDQHFTLAPYVSSKLSYLALVDRLRLIRAQPFSLIQGPVSARSSLNDC